MSGNKGSNIENINLRGQILVNFQYLGQFWKIQVLRISKLTLILKIDQFLAELYRAEVAYSEINFLQLLSHYILAKNLSIFYIQDSF